MRKTKQVLLVLVNIAFAFALHAEEGKVGYWWGDEVTIEDQQSTHAKPSPLPDDKALFSMHPKDLGKLLEEWKEYAIWQKTPESTLGYYRVVNAVRKNAASFTALTEYVMQTNPSLNARVAYPMNTPGRKALTQELNKTKKSLLSNYKEQFALAFFVQQKCTFCHAQLATLKYFKEKHGWAIKIFDIEKRPELSARFNVELTPTLIVIQRGTDAWMPITTGVESLPVIEDNLVRAIHMMTGQRKPQQFNLTLMQAGGFFDPKAFEGDAP